MSRNSYTLLKQATNLRDSLRTLLPDPLTQDEEIAAFYKESLNEVRGRDIITEIYFGMESISDSGYYKRFLMGRSGVGKSTELTRLLQLETVTKQFRPIRFSIKDSLDPTSFKSFDVLLLMVILLTEQRIKVLGQAPGLELIQPILDWYGTETVSLAEQETFARELGGGIEMPKKLREWLGIFGVIKGEIKYASETKTQKVPYRLSRQDTLLRFVNVFFEESNAALKAHSGQEWLFVAEDLDKQGIASHLPSELLITYRSIFEELAAHFIFNVPRDLVYSEQGNELPQFGGEPQVLPETPVYTPEHLPNEVVIAAIETVLLARVSPELFAEPEVSRRLIIASGGDLRTLFRMVTEAATIAGPYRPKITADDADKAISRARNKFYGMLGESTLGERRLTYEEKAQKLMAVYAGTQATRINDPILHSLLRVGAVQEFNGRGWLGVHPMVVDILNEQKLLSSQNTPAPGGTAL